MTAGTPGVDAVRYGADGAVAGRGDAGNLPGLPFLSATWPGNPVLGAGRYGGDTAPALPVRFVASPVPSVS